MSQTEGTKPKVPTNIEEAYRSGTRSRVRFSRPRTVREGGDKPRWREKVGAGRDLAGLEVILDRALDSVWMAYQPIVHAATGSLFGYEALLRSDDPALPDPGAFLEAAEKLGRLYDVGRVVRRKASEPMRHLPLPALLFINLHAVELSDETLISPFAPLTALAPRVVLEITERASLEMIDDVPSRVARLRELGFRIAIDDLGVGYSGLTSFARLDPDFVKLDVSLVRDIHKNPMKRKLVRYMTALCKDMGIKVVAEGIEVVEERDTIVELGCDLLQGYLLAMPGKAFPEVRGWTVSERLPDEGWRTELPTVLECGEARMVASNAVAKAPNERMRRVPLPPSRGKATRVGTCELCFELATGGMATVYLGVHHGAQGFKKLVAVKRLLPSLCADPHYVAMLADEASVSSNTNHSCIRQVFDLGIAEDGTPYLVMEFLAGEPLSRVCVAMRDQPDLLQTTRHHRVVSRIVASCCHGIHAAHELSDRQTPLEVVHRDLTPQNLFALHDGTVRVTDFGIMRARVRRQRPSGQTVLKGKVAYMSPEYLARKPYDRRSDVWTLGVVLWELLTGLRLFRKQSEADTSAAVLFEPVPVPSAFSRNIDPRLDDIVAKAVARNVDERYATAYEMAQNLEAYLASNGDPVGPSDVGGWLRQILPDSLPMLTALVEATRSGAFLSPS
jgi:EAL domain-containing protein (putative c-di-GMP-specific phosphodiesterase class I)